MSSPSVSFQTKVEEAAKVMKITPDELWGYLSTLGVEKNDDDAAAVLQHLSEKDAREVLVDHGKVKIARFSAGWFMLAAAVSKAPQQPGLLTDVVAALRPVTQFKDSELLEAYGPECSSDVAAELKRRANDRPFLVFDGDKLDVDASIKLLHVARRRNTPDTTMIKGKLVRVCRVGEFPMLWIDECPVHADVALVDGYCEKCRNSWEKVPMEERIYVRVAINGGIDLDEVDVNQLIKEIGGGKRIGGDLLVETPDNDSKYRELKVEDRLPKLRRKLSSTVEGKSDPFYQHKEW